MATFMVVDDSTFMRMVLTNIIEKAGYKVIAEASNGLEAIEKFIETSPDAVIMDLTMEHMDGMEALKKIKKINQNTEVIICSSMAHQYNVEEAIGAGASEFISKPVDEKKLTEAIRNIFNKQKITCDFLLFGMLEYQNKSSL